MRHEDLDSIAEELSGGSIDALTSKIASHVNADARQISRLLLAIKRGTPSQNLQGRTDFKITQKSAGLISRGIAAEATAQKKTTLTCLGGNAPSIENLFSTSPNSGRRNGQAVTALPVLSGNIV